MILGFDIAPAYPYVAILVVLMALVILWRSLGYVSNATKVLSALVEQVGTNGKSTLRAELTALADKTESVRLLLVQKAEADRGAAVIQVDAMAAQDRAIAQLQGLVKILGETMGSMGLDQQIRNLLEAQKVIAATTLNVIQANAEQMASSTTTAGKDMVGANKSVGGDEVGAGKAGGTKIVGTLEGTLTQDKKE